MCVSQTLLDSNKNWIALIVFSIFYFNRSYHTYTMIYFIYTIKSLKRKLAFSLVSLIIFEIIFISIKIYFLSSPQYLGIIIVF